MSSKCECGADLSECVPIIFCSYCGRDNAYALPRAESDGFRDEKAALLWLLDRIASWTCARWDQHLRDQLGDEMAEKAIRWIRALTPPEPATVGECERCADILDDARKVLDEKCAPDERHCSCVPHLRRALDAHRACTALLRHHRDRILGALSDRDQRGDGNTPREVCRDEIDRALLRAEAEAAGEEKTND